MKVITSPMVSKMLKPVSFLLLGLGGLASLVHVKYEMPLKDISTSFDLSGYDKDKNERINGFEALNVIRDEFDTDKDGKLSPEEKANVDSFLQSFHGTFFANVLHTRNRLREMSRDLSFEINP